MNDYFLVLTLFVYGPVNQRFAPISQRIVRSDMSKEGILASLLYPTRRRRQTDRQTDRRRVKENERQRMRREGGTRREQNDRYYE